MSEADVAASLAQMIRERMTGPNPLEGTGLEGIIEKRLARLTERERAAPAGDDANAVADRRKEIMRLIREEFDPTPDHWEGRDWDDNAEDVAEKIAALFAPAAPATDTRGHQDVAEDALRLIAAAASGGPNERLRQLYRRGQDIQRDGVSDAAFVAEEPEIAPSEASGGSELWGADASRWASAFRQRAIKLGYSDMDEDWLFGWFANAIELGRAAHPDTKRERARADKLTDALEGTMAVLDATPAQRKKHHVRRNGRWCTYYTTA